MDLQNQSLDHDVVKASSEDPRDKVAKMGKRFLNLIIDTIAVYLLIFLIGVLLAIGGSENSLEDPVQLYAIFFIIYFAYYAGMEATLGKTVGKMLTKTTVVTNTGEKISWGKAFGRTASKLIPFEAFSFLSSHPIGLHDRISGTLVISEN